jgi:hypothetical protein
MAHLTEKGLDPPQNIGVEAWDTYWILWLQRLADAFPKVGTYSVALTPASVAANTTAEQTFTVEGLVINDILTVNKPSLDAGLGIVNVRVSAADTLAITYINATGSPIVPTSETYKIVSTRL